MKSNISSQIPKSEGYNFATKSSQEEVKVHSHVREEFAMVQCTCCSRMVQGKIIHWPGMPSEKKVLHMPCKSCGKYLGHLELDNQDVLNRMCLDCFEDVISGGDL